jgi:hypothetical protein
VVIVPTCRLGAAAMRRSPGLPTPCPVSDLLAAAIAALVGFTGNELVARYRIRRRDRLGGPLVADGL